jgi:hypothetical protein
MYDLMTVQVRYQIDEIHRMRSRVGGTAMTTAPSHRSSIRLVVASALLALAAWLAPGAGERRSA